MMKILYSHDYPDDTTMEISIREDGDTQLELSFTSEDPDMGTETLVYAGDTNDWRELAGELKKEITDYLDSLLGDDYYDEYSRTALYAFENMLNELGFGQEKDY